MKKKTAGFLIWLVLYLLCMGVALFGGTGSAGTSQVEYDRNMDTKDYQVHVELSEDNSYLVTETITVDMLTPRHGIYRYLQKKGTSAAYDEAGNLEQVPYYASIEVHDANVPIETDTEGSSYVMRFGDEDRTVTGTQVYQFRYRFTPRFQTEDYSLVYYNLFPGSWQNEIPAGSSFSFTFPKDFDHEKLRLYGGEYGAADDASGLLELSWEGNTLTGTLKEELPFLNGITLFAAMDEGYFTGSHTVAGVQMLILIVAVFILAAAVLFFLLFGRDEPIIPSVQFQPPEGLDSAAVGYIIDGSAENKDILSLIIYWADKGYLTIEQETKQKLFLCRTGKEFPSDAPDYARAFFERLFRDGDRVSIKSLQYKCAETIQASRTLVKREVDKKGGIYTKLSRFGRGLFTALGVIPLAVFAAFLTEYTSSGMVRIALYWLAVVMLLLGSLVFNHAVNSWYARSKTSRTGMGGLGIGSIVMALVTMAGTYLVQISRGEVFQFIPAFVAVLVSSGVTVFLTAFMKRRTDQCVEWMGRLSGLREFIETAELDRLKVMAEENPEWFYHILPYTYVFGLSEIFASKLEDLALPAPEWYVSSVPGYPVWNYYYFHHALMHSMTRMNQTLTIAEPPKSSGGSSGLGGGFGGGGGFSGGGFGGGGGGSW